MSINFLGPLGGVIFAALIFSVLHIGWHSILDLLFALGVGVYFSLIVLRTTSLWGVTVAHGAISTMVFIVVPLLLVPIAVSPVAGAPLIPSGSTGTLHWRYSPLAKDYRLQVAHCSQGCINALKKIGETSSPPSYVWQKHEIHGFVTYKIHGIVTFKPKVFHVHVTTAILKGTRVTIPVIGKQWYYWRVQSNVFGRWGPFGLPGRLKVIRPTLTKPSGLAMTFGPPAAHGRQTQLCWTPVPGATAYRVFISRVGHATNKNCLSRQFGPERYSWRVRPYSVASVSTSVVSRRPSSSGSGNATWVGQTGSTTQFGHSAPQGLTASFGPRSRYGVATHLCWQPISAATGYRVSLTRHNPIPTRHACVWRTLAIGSYVMQVSATLRGSKPAVSTISMRSSSRSARNTLPSTGHLPCLPLCP